MRTSDKVLSILTLFSAERPEWTVEAASSELNLTQTTAYDHFRSLVKAELITSTGQGKYGLGPAVVELDRMVRQTDPLLVYGESMLEELAYLAPANVVTLLCRLYQMKVMCVGQRGQGIPGHSISYERGRLMPLLRGAASKIILANVERRRLRRYYDENAEAISQNMLGQTWDEFRNCLRTIRQQGVLITRGELDEGLVGVSAPVFTAGGEIMGSISFVTEARIHDQSPAIANELSNRIRQAGRSLSMRLGFTESPAG